MADHLPESAVSAELEQCRGYVRLLAELNLAAELRPRLDASDIVQQVLLKANAAASDLQHPNSTSVKAWLRTILTNELIDAFKFHHRNRRDVDRERSVAADIDQSAAGLEGWLIDDQTSPSRQAMRNEETLRLADALLKLPDATREVVVLKHLRNLTLKEITDQTGRTSAAVAGLLRRGLATLREHMSESL